MDDAPESRAGDVALMVLGAVTTLACASAIGAAATLVVMTPYKPASSAAIMFAGGAAIPGPSKAQEVIVQPVLAPQSGECVLMAWKTGMIYCIRNNSDNEYKPVRNGPAVVVQAQADVPAR
jgi:hypothetical protein